LGPLYLSVFEAHAKLLREATGEVAAPRWLAPLQQQLQQARVALERAASRAGDLDDSSLDMLQAAVGALLASLETMAATLAARAREDSQP
jgi:hypothetical protein